jgi:Guanine nucleotide exchange factor synembryn
LAATQLLPASSSLHRYVNIRDESSELDWRLQNLQILLNLGTDSRESHAEAAYEAMRCVANALLLIDAGRDTWLDIQGGEACVEMLEVSPCFIVVLGTNIMPNQRSPSPQSIFLASRILFLTTVKQSPFTRKLVEELRIVNIVSQRLDSLMNSILSGQAMAREAMVDTLKFTFNLLLQYPRMVDAEEGKGQGTQDTPQSRMRELWSDNLEKYVSVPERLTATHIPN